MKRLGSGGAAGVVCGGGTQVLSNSLIYNNTKAGGTQFSGTCTYSYIASDETLAGTGSVGNAAPDVVNTNAANGPIDYHLAGMTANNTACCIDHVPSSTVVIDYDTRKRPQGMKWDIGAHEVMQ